ncbi:hypothetical protein [Serratia marcescens]|uniref:hypothetical protein n=1 Tax=Serratia marcescens TaxID=615 RepID=UPI00148D2542|nr:hypothetical protein [Serratia marcescens]QJU39625.1 hypothetical protein HMI62_09975 [Serratia marcescens]
MKVTNATLVIDELHDEVYAVSENNQIIGYLAGTKNDELPFGAVSPVGLDLGDFDCPDCAIKTIYSTAHNITHGRMITGTDPRKMFFEALLMSLFEQSKAQNTH